MRFDFAIETGPTFRSLVSSSYSLSLYLSFGPLGKLHGTRPLVRFNQVLLGGFFLHKTLSALSLSSRRRSTRKASRWVNLQGFFGVFGGGRQSFALALTAHGVYTPAAAAAPVCLA